MESLVRPHYAKAGNGRQPVGLSIMLRTYFMQQWFNLSDPGVEELLYESALSKPKHLRVAFPSLVAGRRRRMDNGIAKNHNRLCADFALVNLYLHRKRLALLG